MASEVPELGGEIRRLMRRCRRVSLATLDATGAPYASLAMVALDHDAAPLLYLSDLADHTRNLKRDERVSLLFDGTLTSSVPLAGERATIQGRIARADEPRLLARYVALNPDAAAYAGFRDFNPIKSPIAAAWPGGSAPVEDRYGSSDPLSRLLGPSASIPWVRRCVLTDI